VRHSGLLLIGQLLLSPLALAGQEPATVSGRVVDQRTGEGIAGAEVWLNDERRSALSDGRFRFGSVEPGRHWLEVRAVGYAARQQAVLLLQGQTENVTIALAPLPVLLDSLAVFASADQAIDGAALAGRGNDLATALDGWEGIVVTRTGSGNEAVLQIRGSSADQVLVLVDGFALNDPFTGRADLNRVAVRDVEQVTVLRGAQTARAGSRAIAGVIEIATRRLHAPEMSLGIGSENARRARVAGGTGFASVALSVERLPEDYFVDQPSGGEVQRANADGELWTLNAKASPGGDLTVRGTMSDRGLPGTIVNPTLFARAHDRSLLVGWTTGQHNYLTASLQWLDTRAADHAPPPGFVAYDAHTRGWGGTLGLGLRRPVEVGGWEGEYALTADGRHDRFDGDGVRDQSSFNRAGTSVSATLIRTSGRSVWTLSPAFRLDWYTGRNAPLWSGRFDLRFSRGRSSIDLGFGSSVTAPVLADLLFRDGVGVAINPNLRPERVRWEGELGFGHDLRLMGAATSLRVRGYYGQIDDMILWTPNFHFIWSPGNFAVLRRGGEVGLETRPAGSLVISGSAALNVVTYDIPGGAQVRYRPRVTYSVHGSWMPGLWRLNLGWNHVGTRYPNAVGTNPLEPIDLLNAGIERRVGQVLSVRGEVRDLTDSRPVYIAGFPSPGRSYHLSLTLEFP